MEVLGVLLLIFIVNAFILWILIKLGKLSRESTLYKRLDMLLVNLPLGLMWVYLLYLFTDTNKDLALTLFISSIIGLIIYIFDKRIKANKYINSIGVILVTSLIFILFSMIIMFTSIDNAHVLSIIIIGNLAKQVFKSDNTSENANIIAITMAVIFIILGIFTNYSIPKTKPERVADKYIIEKGYDLDNVSYRNIDSSMVREERLNMSYTINNAEDSRELDKIISMTYYKGKIIEYNVAEF